MENAEGSAASPARRRRHDPVAAQWARLAAASAARGVVWAILTVSLLGTAVTAPYLPSPWGRPLVVLGILGGLGSGLVALYRLFIAFMAMLGLTRHAVPERTGGRGKPRAGLNRPKDGA